MQRIFSYFSFRGRSNRQRYWIAGVTIFGLYFISALAAAALAELPVVSILGGLLFFVLIPVVAVAILANGARRLHDRGMSAWWLVVFVVLPTLLSIPARLVQHVADEDVQMFGAALALLGLPFSIWGFVVMGCLKGTTGPNRYGDDPLQSAVQEVFA